MLYYRLRQTDFDGKFTVSEIIAVEQIDTKTYSLTFDLFPNPINRNQMPVIEITNFEPETEVHLIVTDALGKERFSGDISTDTNGFVSYTIDMNQNLEHGLYFVTATSLNTTYNRTLVVD